MNCPKCQSAPLAPLDLLGGIEVDHCSQCDGIYFQKGEMGSYLRFANDVPGYKDLLKSAKPSCTCPECGKQMKELQYVPGEQLLVDHCEACGGVWLDGGETVSVKKIADKQDDRRIRLMRGIWEMRSKVKGVKTMVCPRCKTPSINEFSTGEGVTLDMCDRCNGCWFEKGEVATYFELSQDIPELQKALATARPTDSRCPRCVGAPLVELEYSQIKLSTGKLKVDYCKKCEGLWLDKGEVSSLEGLSTVMESPGARLGRAVKELMDKGYVVMGG